MHAFALQLSLAAAALSSPTHWWVGRWGVSQAACERGLGYRDDYVIFTERHINFMESECIRVRTLSASRTNAHLFGRCRSEGLLNWRPSHWRLSREPEGMAVRSGGGEWHFVPCDDNHVLAPDRQ